MARLYFLTMDDAPMDHVQQVEAACRAGIRWIQLRMKQASDEQVLEAARAAKKICLQWNCKLIINDRVVVALEADVDGVHLGEEDMPVSEARRILGRSKTIGGTANTLEDIRERWKQGADYIGLGPYRFTTTKKNLSPILGLEGYRRVLAEAKVEGICLPVVAIGGIKLEDAASLFEAGLQGIAFSGMLVHSVDWRGMVQELEQEIYK
ncbi:MAG TPA: thiamine phosphate synthase [Puia sp.]